MFWSLNGSRPENQQELEAFLLLVGKALYLASNFEANCRRISSMAELANAFQAGKTWAEACAKPEARHLGGAVQYLSKDPEVREADAAVLDAAREGRNVIAHEIAELGPLDQIRPDKLSERKRLLRKSVDAIVAGDNLVCRWLFELDDFPAPRGIQDLYAARVAAWLWDKEDNGHGP
jgi:hypothetical protein